jgi:endonuclease/exonuclease/phosphatase family metal-dependent hydrolase
MEIAMMNRRQFLGIAGSLPALTALPTFAQSEKNQLRVIAYNVFGCTGWPSNRPLTQEAMRLGQMPKRLADELALYDPDIINFSEAPEEAVVKEIAERLEMNYVMFPTGQSRGGALLTRFEIVESKNCPIVGGERPRDLFVCHWGMAEVRLSDDETLIVHSAHLRAGRVPEIRKREITEMIRSMQPDREAGKSLLVMGDLNHSPEQEEYNLWTEAGLIDTFAEVGEGDGATFRSDIAQWRIDYVWASGPIAENIIESRPLYQGSFRLNIDDKQSFALSDHLPQLAVFELE